MSIDDWYRCWNIHLEQYLKTPPRTGMFIYAFFPTIKTSLEIACGSSRDSIYLAKKGVEATASDYEGRIIEDLKKRFNYPFLKYQQADAFHLPFQNDSFDIVFHNGFFILFSENYDIQRLLVEQARVAKEYVLFFVHNKLNAELVRNFQKLAPTDPIYDIRFFEPDEIKGIVYESAISIRSFKILKFGGPYDILFSKRIKRILPNVLYPFRTFIVPRLYKFQSWQRTERVVCLIELNK
jgi:hypothetical protein